MSRKTVTRCAAAALAAAAVTAACTATAGNTVPARCDHAEDACTAVYNGHEWRFVSGARGEAIARQIARHRLPGWLTVQPVPARVRSELHIGPAVPAIELVGPSTTFVVTPNRVYPS